MDTVKRVFMSYAWESEEFKQSVWELAGWLEAASGNRIEVISDHLFSVIPPPDDWHIWMHREITSCDLVLSICTPKYKKAFEGNAFDDEGGFGATHEGLIITAKFYSGKGRNTKYYPILPDGGEITNIPDILSGYFNNTFRFSSGNQHIYNLILGENPVHAGRKAKALAAEIAKIDVEAKEAIKLENELVSEIAKSVDTIKTDMSYDLQILVRSYLSLSDSEKDDIIKIVNKDTKIETDDPDERDKLFLTAIQNKQLLSELWSAVNDVDPFENPVNPFQ